MNYKKFPLTLGVAYTLVTVLLTLFGTTEFRIYVIVFAISTIILETAFYPYPKNVGRLVSLITVSWIILSSFYILQIFGVI
ncbi:hypothetical protein [Acidianus sp. RZ1]|uniref:hypothetical protein n=1 Tax=Acidianus sp. RZ1 TaxID=1540082 RepID=UPI001492FE32|nr:hypothetical protein [Acidianus sp. RZ1]NON63043.1 hypothetical protein [Acidianus sp. RZ1]